MELPIGEIAALSAAFSFSITSICFTFAGRKISAMTSAGMSLPISLLAIFIIHMLMVGELFPSNASIERISYLSISGILAYVIATYFMLNAYQYIGPRLTILIASFSPALSTVFAWIFLGQTLPANAMFAIAIVLFGIVWVVAEPRKKQTEIPNPNLGRGLLFACLSTLGQSMAFVFSSLGVAGEFSPISGSLIRLMAGVIGVWLVIAYQQNIKSTLEIFNKDRVLFGQLSVAAITGPALAGSLILLSFQLIPVGITTTLSHTTAIVMIPLSYFIFKERITPRAIIGTVVAIVGIAIMFS